jgi:hypothetical protein
VLGSRRRRRRLGAARAVEAGAGRGGGDERRWWGWKRAPRCAEREDGGEPVKESRAHGRWDRLWDHYIKTMFSLRQAVNPRTTLILRWREYLTRWRLGRGSETEWRSLQQTGTSLSMCWCLVEAYSHSAPIHAARPSIWCGG